MVYESSEVDPEGQAHALTNYFACRGSIRPEFDAVDYNPYRFRGDGVFPAVTFATRLTDIRDGTSTTILVGEQPAGPWPDLGWWACGSGVDLLGLGDAVLDTADPFRSGHIQGSQDFLHYWSTHPGGAHIAMCDGSVRFVAYSIDAPTFQSLGSRNGAEVVGEF